MRENFAQLVEDILPNLTALRDGRVAGVVADWPMLRKEARIVLRLLAHTLEEMHGKDLETPTNPRS